MARRGGQRAVAGSGHGQGHGHGPGGDPVEALVQEAARLICDEQVVDYRSAKHKALQRLGLPPRTPLPDNARIQAAVVAYQRIFGGAAYAERLIALRRAAVQALRLLQPFSPRLVGGVVTGAINGAHRVQIHAFADRAEALDLFLADRAIPFEQDERDYRYPDGREQAVPLARFEAGDIGIDVAMFALDDQRRTPLSPADGLPVKRLGLAEAEALAQIGSREILGG